MEKATIPEIDEDTLQALIRSFPNLWDTDKQILEPGIHSLLEKSGETDDFYFAVIIFSVVRGILTVFVEYQKQTREAVFEIHGYVVAADQIQGRHQYAERRLRDIILSHAGDPYSKLSTISEDRIFECPHCRARYLLSTLRMSSDRRVECQNCSRLVDFEI